MLSGTFDQGISFSKKFGGVRKVFEAKPWLLVGGFDFNLEDLPAAGQVLPAGAPVNCNEETRKITPIYTIKVKEVAENVVTVAKDSWGVPVKVGMVAAGGGNITAVEDAGDTYKVTFDTAPSTAVVDSVVAIYPKSVGSAGVKANALLPYDVCLDPAATWAKGEGAWMCEYPVLANRTFPLTDEIKTQLREAGCGFYFSTRK